MEPGEGGVTGTEGREEGEILCVPETSKSHEASELVNLILHH